MSKGSFKRAIGHLYKQKIINIETGKITLTKKAGVELTQKNNHFTYRRMRVLYSKLNRTDEVVLISSVHFFHI